MSNLTTVIYVLDSQAYCIVKMLYTGSNEAAAVKDTVEVYLF
jgi:hypothetical protein